MPRFRPSFTSLAAALALFTGATSFMPSEIYSSGGWFMLWAATAVSLAAVIVRVRMWRTPQLFVMHAGMVVMLLGGGATSLTSTRGTLHLRPSVPACTFVAEDGERLRLPDTLTLRSFSPEYYSGMSFPKDFRSEIITAGGCVMNISMNKIGKLDGYRFYQTSFDDEGGTILTVSHDPWGIPIAYLGFFLFALGGAVTLAVKLVRGGISGGRRCAAAMILLASAYAAPASAAPAVSKACADSLSGRQVSFCGRVVPFNTVASRVTLKLTGRPKVGSLTPEQFVASVANYREEWSGVPFIAIKSAPLRKALGADGKYVSLRSLYDDSGSYIPGALYRGGAGKLDDAILRLDEKVAILMELWNGTLFAPAGRNDKPRSEFSVRAEIAYNRSSPVFAEFVCSLILACLSFASVFLKRKSALRKLICTAAAAECLVFGWLWYIRGSLPVSDMSEIMQFLGTVVTLLTAFVCCRRYSMLLTALAMLAAAFLFLVAWLGIKDPQLSPLMPVLASPWLAIHVSIVMTAYAILGFTFPIALAALALPRERCRLSALSRALLLPGTYMLGLGIIVGALWANVSWGRYWAWDPKETWALVTLMLYAIPLHRDFFRHVRLEGYNIYVAAIFFSIIMTYAGVNCLQSLHAYN